MKRHRLILARETVRRLGIIQIGRVGIVGGLIHTEEGLCIDSRDWGSCNCPTNPMICPM